MKAGEQFFNFYNHGFILAAVAIPIVRVADATFNADQIIALMQKAASSHTAVTLFPELGLSPTPVRTYSSKQPCSNHASRHWKGSWKPPGPCRWCGCGRHTTPY